MIPIEIAVIFLGSIAAGTTYTAYLYHKDLQYIRINGTLVGGLVGLLLHALTQLAAG